MSEQVVVHLIAPIVVTNTSVSNHSTLSPVDYSAWSMPSMLNTHMLNALYVQVSMHTAQCLPTLISPPIPTAIRSY